MKFLIRYIPVLLLILPQLFTAGCSPYSGSSLLVEVTATISGEVVPDEDGNCPGEFINDENLWVDGGYYANDEPDGLCTIQDNLVVVARDEVQSKPIGIDWDLDGVFVKEITSDSCSTGGDTWEYDSPIAGVVFTVEFVEQVDDYDFVPFGNVGEYVDVEWTARMKSLHTDWTWQPAAQQILGNDRLLILGNICPDGSKQ